MSDRATRLNRLLAIRKLSEELDRRSLKVAVARVEQVQSALACQDNALADAHRLARQALAAGDRSQWLMADAQAEVAAWNRTRLLDLLKRRAEAVAPAMERYMESRRAQEQIADLVGEARAASASEGERKAQLVADDWFLSRRERLGPEDDPESPG